MTEFVFDDFARTTLSGARNTADGKPLSAAKVDQIIAYLKSPGSGPDATSSYSDYVAKKMEMHPPTLPAGKEYVGFSGVDGAGTSNFNNALKYVADVDGKAGIIGDTPWGGFVERASGDPEFGLVEDKFRQFMKSQGAEPFKANYQGALQDIMWNAGSPRYFENAVASRRPIVAFVENAPPRRGFSSFELTTALKHPEAVINGYPVSAFGKDPLAFAGKSAAEFQRLEETIAQLATRNSGQAVGVAEVRSTLRLAEGYDAVNKTLFDQPVAAFKTLTFDEMSAARTAWTASRPGAMPDLHLKPTAGAPERALKSTDDAVLAGERAAARGLRPGIAMKGLGIAGAAATAYDIGDTAHDVSRLSSQGNATAAQARIERFAVQNAAGWGGAVAGMGAGALAGVETGPGLLVTGAIGGIVGAVAGDKVADWLNERKINRQDDGRGNTWTFDPHHPDRGWTRTEGSLIDRLQGESRTLTADAALSDRLTRQASNTSIELALGSPPQSRDPYMLPAAAGDTRSLQRSDWMRDPKTGAWQREVVDQFLEHGIKISHSETANPQRAAQLERQSQAIVEGNAARTPAAMAAQYQAAYERNGWSRHGAVPAVVTDAQNHPGRVVGSDGNLYERDARGQWTHDGMLWDSRADGNLLRELEATYSAQQKGREASITTLEPVTVRPDASLTGQSRGVAPAGKDGRPASTDPERARFFPMVESLGLAALDTPRKVGQVAGALESAGLRDNVEIQRVAANRDQSVVFGIQGDPSTAGGYRQTHVKVADALAMEPQAIARERENAQAMAQERDAQAASITRQGPMLA